MMQTATGKSIVNGIAIGHLRIFRKEDPEITRGSGLTPEEEWKRFDKAISEAQEQLDVLHDEALGKVGRETAAIFESYRMMLKDEAYLDSVKRLIQVQNATAEYAVAQAGEAFAGRFAKMNDTYMQARADDVKDISRRVVNILTGKAEQNRFGEDPVILVADELTPSETVQLDKSKLLGFITRYGSANSHTAILARIMNIPALTGVDFDESWDGKQAVLDGYGQCVYLEPSAELLARMQHRHSEELKQKALLQELKGKPNVTLDGKEIKVYANIGDADDVDSVLGNDAQGIGLFRSEFIYLNAENYPTEEEQFIIYKRVVEAMKGKSVTIRTLDIGTDKQTDYFELGREENPALGYRAIRICLTRKEIFKQQLRAILRAAAFGNVSIMLPFIISLQEVREAKQILEECRAELLEEGKAAGTVEIGVMIETPAAVMIADELAKEADFLSLGTNDLTQYALAVDRLNPRLDVFYDAHHPAVLRMIQMTVDAGHRHGCRVGICGELSADMELTETFLRMGMDELSVVPSAVLPMRKHIRSLDLSK